MGILSCVILVGPFVTILNREKILDQTLFIITPTFQLNDIRSIYIVIHFA